MNFNKLLTRHTSPHTPSEADKFANKQQLGGPRDALLGMLEASLQFV